MDTTTAFISISFAVIAILSIFIMDFLIVMKSKKNNAEKNNRIYACENKECKHSYFRIYQLMRHYTQRTSSEISQIGGGKFAFELAELKDDELDIVIYCPYCKGLNVKRSNSYKWMETAEEFPELSVKQLKRYSTETSNPVGIKIVLETLSVIESSLDEIGEVISYQVYYEIKDKDVNAEYLESKLVNIANQVNLIKSQTYSCDVHQSANRILESIDDLIAVNLTLEKN